MKKGLRRAKLISFIFLTLFLAQILSVHKAEAQTHHLHITSSVVTGGSVNFPVIIDGQEFTCPVDIDLQSGLHEFSIPENPPYVTRRTIGAKEYVWISWSAKGEPSGTKFWEDSLFPKTFDLQEDTNIYMFVSEFKPKARRFGYYFCWTDLNTFPTMDAFKSDILNSGFSALYYMDGVRDGIYHVKVPEMAQFSLQNGIELDLFLTQINLTIDQTDLFIAYLDFLGVPINMVLLGMEYAIKGDDYNVHRQAYLRFKAVCDSRGIKLGLAGAISHYSLFGVDVDDGRNWLNSQECYTLHFWTHPERSMYGMTQVDVQNFVNNIVGTTAGGWGAYDFDLTPKQIRQLAEAQMTTEKSLIHFYIAERPNAQVPSRIEPEDIAAYSSLYTIYPDVFVDGSALVSLATITGTITDEETEDPIVNAKVTLDGYQNTTDADGVFTLNVPLGSYNITISKEGYFNQSFALDCPTEGTYQIGTIALWPIPPPEKGTLRVHAYSNESEVAANVKVTGVGNFATPFAMNLDPGPYTLNSTYANQTQTMTVEISEGQITLAEFNFEAPSVLEPEPETEPEPTPAPNPNPQTAIARVPEFTSILIAISLGVGGYLLGRRSFRRKDKT